MFDPLLRAWRRGASLVHRQRESWSRRKALLSEEQHRRHGVKTPRPGHGATPSAFCRCEVRRLHLGPCKMSGARAQTAARRLNAGAHYLATSLAPGVGARGAEDQPGRVSGSPRTGPERFGFARFAATFRPKQGIESPQAANCRHSSAATVISNASFSAIDEQRRPLHCGHVIFGDECAMSGPYGVRSGGLVHAAPFVARPRARPKTGGASLEPAAIASMGVRWLRGLFSPRSHRTCTNSG